MNARHTPGPWRHKGQGGITGVENNGGSVDICAVYLRMVPGKHDANARLIAAAPELLTALEHAIETLSAEGFDVSMYRAIITKAAS